ncbi:glycosyltransferase family 4 protein [Mucilaginibacter sp. KACC 22063]|uniref:glycosyltransferase family 4 protein n=1 Tax=Mucilaginibacter sp. KACC 22063 TaxID=3025666 RepID=UPI0023672A0F|nr:glycosyltransferase family 1 protein [Mucilaginibacter sp. KACC 22063]WDF53998.1 glycosyltransferase family 1 protein [Mucilaginibacter sp. KACC 22063]
MPKPLTIGVDIRDLRVSKTGMKTYLEELCREFKQLETNDLKFKFIDVNIPVFEQKNAFFKYLEHLRYHTWKQVILPLKAFMKGCDVLICTDNFAPVINLGFRTVPVFHDAFFFESPENYGKLWLWLYHKTAIPAARRSLFVVTPTNYAKDQIKKYTHLSDEKLKVIYEGPKLLKAERKNKQSLLSEYQLKPHQYLLHVGSMFKRKNIPALINAFVKLKDTGYAEMKLVLVGSISTNRFDNDHDLILDTIKKSKFRPDIFITGYLTDDQIDELYTNALAYVFPSLNEGFGIPVLEAFEHHLPVLVADNTCLPEVGGNAVLSFNPFDTDDIAYKIKKVIDVPQLRADMIEKGNERIKAFSWRKTALGFIEAIRNSI